VAVVCLDPGHGGKDVGVGGAGILEKDLTLAVCQRVRGMLEGRGYKVYLTRAGDFALALDERAGLANHRQVEAFVSLHADYGVSPAASGPKLYSYAEPAHEVVRPGAQATNPANWRRVSALTRSEGVRLARAIALGFEEAGTPAMAVREAPLAVLAGARMPAVVVEVGVLPAQAAKLARPDTQNELARAIARGIEIFFRPGAMPAVTTPAAVTP
jgi:N-acetylmuramoyl-L-alanine amidase